MKRQGGFLTKATGTLATMLSSTVLNFLVNVFLARVLGPEGKGTVTPALSAATIAVALAAFGVDNSLAYFLDKKSFKPRDVILTSLVFSLISGSLAFAGTFLVLEFLTPEATWLTRIFFAAGTFFTVCYTVTQSALLGRNRIGLINVGRVASDFLRTALTTLFLYWLWPSVEGFAFAYMTAQALNVILATVFAFGEVGIRDARIDFGYLTKAVGFGIGAFLATLTIQANRQIGILILKIMVTTEETGIYSQAFAFVNLLLLVPQALSYALYGAVVGEKGKEEFTARTVRLSLVLLLVLAGITAAIAPWIVPFLFTQKFAASVPYLWGLLPSIIFYALPSLYSSFVIASWGKPWYVFLAGIIGLVLNVLCSLILIPYWGSWGAVAAFNVSALAMSVYYLILLKKIGGLGIRQVVVPYLEDFSMLIKRLRPPSSQS